MVYTNSLTGWYPNVIAEIANTLKDRANTGDYTLLPDFSFLEEAPQRRDNGYGNKGDRGQRPPRNNNQRR